MDPQEPRNQNPAVAGEEVVNENELAELIGLPASAVRAMMSGSMAIPPELEGVIPEPTRVTNLVWRKEDALAAAARYKEQERDRQLQLEEAERRRQADIYAAQRAREAERERATEQFGHQQDDFDELLESRMPIGVKPDKKGFWTALAEAWKTLTAPSEKPGKPKKSTASEKTETDTIAVLDDGTQVIAPASRTSIERSSMRGAEAPRMKREKKAEEPSEARKKRADEKAAAALAHANEVAETEDAKKAAKAQKAAEKEAARAEKERLKAESQDAKSADTEDKRALAAARKAEAKARREEARKTLKGDSSKSLEDKKLHKAEAKRAKKETLERYKRAMEVWKEDAKVAKENGVKPPRKPKKPKFSTSKPNPLDVIAALRAFAMMLDNSPGELDSMETMVREYEGSQIGEALRRIHFRVAEQNATLVEAFAPEKIFPAEVHNMLQVGAKTASAGESLRVAVKLLDAQLDNKRNLLGEIGEPILVGLLSLAALFATAWMVMPTFVTMYDSLDMPVPPISKLILQMSDVTGWVLIVIAAIVGVYAAWWFIAGRKNDRWRTTLDTYKLHMPLMGKANMTAETSHTIKVLNAYMGAGAPEREALADAAEASGNRAVRKHLETTAELMLQGRATFADTFDTDLFPSMVRNIVATGEKSGRILEMLETLDETYEREADIEAKAAVRRVSGTIAGVSSMIFTVVVTMVTVPPLEMFGSTLSYGQ